MIDHDLEYYKKAGAVFNFPLYALSELDSGYSDGLTFEQANNLTAFYRKVEALGYDPRCYGVLIRGENGYHVWGDMDDIETEFCENPEFGEPTECVKLFYCI